MKKHHRYLLAYYVLAAIGANLMPHDGFDLRALAAMFLLLTAGMVHECGERARTEPSTAPDEPCRAKRS